MSKNVPQKLPVWTRLFPNDKAALQKLANAKQRSMAEIVRESILSYIERETLDTTEDLL